MPNVNQATGGGCGDDHAKTDVCRQHTLSNLFFLVCHKNPKSGPKS